MYDDLVKSLRDKAEFLDRTSYERNVHNSFADAMKQAADAIENLDHIAETYAETVHELEDKNRWFSVTETLPKCEWGAEVGNIVWISCGMVFAGCFGRGGKYRDAYFRTWTDGTDGIDAKGADYWRQIQIPEPPKEET